MAGGAVRASDEQLINTTDQATIVVAAARLKDDRFA